MDSSDEQLIASYLKGDESSLEQLFNRYLKPIFGFVFRYLNDPAETENITQEVFVKVWANLKKFDTKKKFKTWLYTIAKNTVYDFFKKKKSLPFSNFENTEGDNLLLDNLSDSNPLPDELFAKTDLADQLNKAMAHLPPDARAVIHLYYLEQFTLQEIADSLQESINTIKSRHRRALITLRKIMKID